MDMVAAAPPRAKRLKVDFQSEAFPAPGEMLGSWFRVWHDDARQHLRGMYKASTYNPVDQQYALSSEESHLVSGQDSLGPRTPVPYIHERLKRPGAKYKWISGYKPGGDSELGDE